MTKLCGRGLHPMTPANTYRPPAHPGTNLCRECRAARERSRPRKSRGSGRGMGWRKQPLNARRAGRVARYYAGRLLLAAVEAGELPPDVVAAYGPEGLQKVSQALLELSWRLESSGDPKGRPSR